MMHALILLLLLTGIARGDSQTGVVPSATRPITTVAGLPACNAALRAYKYFVTDALTPVTLANVAAGGAVQVGVTCNGTAWIVQ